MKNTATTIFLPLLTLMFVYLKLTGQILWSWWWVLLPTWGPFALVLSVLFVFGIILTIAKVFK